MQLLDDPLNAPVARQYWHRTKPNPWEPCRWVRWIGQRGETDCGIAALAMVVGQSYGTVRTLFPHQGQSPLRQRGLSRADSAAFLKLYRCRIAWKAAPRKGAPAMVRYRASDPAYAVVVGSDEDYHPLRNTPMAMAVLLGGLGLLLVAGALPSRTTGYGNDRDTADPVNAPRL
jgi:hypothetical protein